MDTKYLAEDPSNLLLFKVTLINDHQNTYFSSIHINCVCVNYVYVKGCTV